MENKDFKVGDLVRLKSNLKHHFFYHFIEKKQFGIGIIIHKLTELKIPTSDDLVKVKVCKVYWFDVTKNTWEYENDLQNA